MENAIIRIGTGGWSYPSWKKIFYPAGLKAADEFEWYTQQFSSIELNNTFYKLPSPEQFFEWKQRAPDDFVFSIKASRFITQMKKLKTDTPAVQRLLDNAAWLEEKLGPILFELPPRWKLNTERLREFLEHIPKGYLYAFEFREPTWFTQEVYQLLEQHHCAFCISDSLGQMSPHIVTADFVYLRLYGSAERFRSSYNDEQLGVLAVHCRDWKANDKDVYLYFVNDHLGYAPRNAQRLLELIQTTA
jgi:uncharacterized protein YecE (DUF72 family)